MKEFRKGDRIQVTGTIAECGMTAALVQFDGDCSGGNTLSPGAMSKATLLPRQLRVGDRVNHKGIRHITGTILVIDELTAGVKWETGYCCFYLLSDLVLVDKEK